MSTSTFVRYSGVAAIMAGLFTVAGTLLELNVIPASGWVYLVSTLATVLALIGIYLYQKQVRLHFILVSAGL